MVILPCFYKNCNRKFPLHFSEYLGAMTMTQSAGLWQAAVHRTAAFDHSSPVSLKQKSPTANAVGLFWQMTIIRIQNRDGDFEMSPLA